jgi:hypothetical protein
LTSGLSKEDGITLHSQTIQAIGEEIANRTKKTKAKRWQIPRFRKSGGSRKSLEWIPFKKAAIKYKNGQVWYQNKPLSLWDSYNLSKYELGTGSFTCDARGRWYFNTTIEVPTNQTPEGTGSVGIDLGCKDAITCSDGTKLQGRWYRKQEEQLKIGLELKDVIFTLKYEPKISLFVPDSNPLIFYEKIFEFAQSHLNPNGIIYCETSQNIQLLEYKGFKIDSKLDLSGNPRFIKGIKI